MSPTETITENPPPLPRLAYKPKEVAAMLGCSEKTIYRLLDRGLIRCSKALRHKLISRDEISRFLRESIK